MVEALDERTHIPMAKGMRIIGTEGDEGPRERVLKARRDELDERTRVQKAENNEWDGS